jgi:hypothetical protein
MLGQPLLADALDPIVAGASQPDESEQLPDSKAHDERNSDAAKCKRVHERHD